MTDENVGNIKVYHGYCKLSASIIMFKQIFGKNVHEENKTYVAYIMVYIFTCFINSKEIFLLKNKKIHTYFPFLSNELN